MLRTVLITDDQNQKVQFKERLAQLLPPGTLIRPYTGREATRQDPQGELFFVHTRLNRTNILDLVQKIRNANPAASLAFISDNMEDACFVLNTPFDGFYWLNDPQDRLPEIVDAMLARFHNRAATHLAVRRRGRLHYILKQDILYLERDYRKLIFHMVNGTSLIVYKPLEEILQEIGCGFVRVHNSFIIRAQSVRQLSRDTLILKDDSRIPISRTYLTQTRQLLNHPHNQ